MWKETSQACQNYVIYIYQNWCGRIII